MGGMLLYRGVCVATCPAGFSAAGTGDVGRACVGELLRADVLCVCVCVCVCVLPCLLVVLFFISYHFANRHLFSLSFFLSDLSPI